MARRTFFGWLRLGILLTILLVVALNAWFDRALTRDWDLPLRVTIYPIAQGDEDVAAYANRLEADGPHAFASSAWQATRLFP